MKNYIMIFSVGLFMLFSCQEGELDTGVEEKLVNENTTNETVNGGPTENSGEQDSDDTTDSEEERAEFFWWEIDSTKFETTIGKHIAGTIYSSKDTGVINFDFFGEIIGEAQDSTYNGLLFKVCFFDGEGIYYTGTRETVSWAIYWDNFDMWENHYSFGNEPGVVEVTKATDEYVEGTFEFEAYNPDLENMIFVKGGFSLNLESTEDYNNL
ncbi:hypothetical protein GCM10023115_37120 [Pontixanthobacter gangjinensis]|uniref:Uncharacterized protein n=1 Tax=Christiangramia aestuarii TaxID=1028746 RepID=A0A7K1LQN3_9FLAO|nr:hypothetical protein [Christiangramia aestuarii]MUP43119.1 hypothetical protein [Christiangramia aestuarii]